jgi:hypothetical protein
MSNSDKSIVIISSRRKTLLSVIVDMRPLFTPPAPPPPPLHLYICTVPASPSSGSRVVVRPYPCTVTQSTLFPLGMCFPCLGWAGRVLFRWVPLAPPGLLCLVLGQNDTFLFFGPWQKVPLQGSGVLLYLLYYCTVREALREVLPLRFSSSLPVLLRY